MIKEKDIVCIDSELLKQSFDYSKVDLYKVDSIEGNSAFIKKITPYGDGSKLLLEDSFRRIRLSSLRKR